MGRNDVKSIENLMVRRISIEIGFAEDEGSWLASSIWFEPNELRFQIKG